MTVPGRFQSHALSQFEPINGLINYVFLRILVSHHRQSELNDRIEYRSGKFAG